MTRNLERRISKLEQSGNRSVPGVFVSWGREAGLDDGEIRAEWANIVDATGSGDDSIGTAWDRSLEGGLFNS